MCDALWIDDKPLIAIMMEDVQVERGATSVEVATTATDAGEAALRRMPRFITSDVKRLKGTRPRAIADIARISGEMPVIFITATPNNSEGCLREVIMRKSENLVENRRQSCQALL